MGSNSEITEVLLAPERPDRPNTQPKPGNPKKLIQKMLESLGIICSMMPAGTVIVFELICPFMAACIFRKLLVIFCGLWSFLSCFTDTVVDSNGTVCVGLVTLSGLWTPLQATKSPWKKSESSYRVKFLDFVHGFLCGLVFLAIAFARKDILECFFSSSLLMGILPVIGLVTVLVCCILFLVCPSHRHCIGMPLMKDPLPVNGLA